VNRDKIMRYPVRALARGKDQQPDRYPEMAHKFLLLMKAFQRLTYTRNTVAVQAEAIKSSELITTAL
jgi:hypothetical protein